MNQETQTPRTDAAGHDGMYSTMVNHALRLELELNAANEKIKNNPWCAACKESDCCVSIDGTCAMIRKYHLAEQNGKERDMIGNKVSELLCRARMGEVGKGMFIQSYELTELANCLNEIKNQ